VNVISPGSAPRSPTTGRSSSPSTSRNSFGFGGMTQVRTSPYYPQSNGRIEHLAQIAQRKVHPGTPLSLEDARRLLRRALQQRPPEQCDRLHHAEGHARWTSAGDPRQQEIQADRDRKLEAARQQRQIRRPVDGRRPGSIIGKGAGSRDHASTQGSHSTRPSRSPDLCRQ